MTKIKKHKSKPNCYTLTLDGMTTGKLITLAHALRTHIDQTKSEVATDILFMLRNVAMDMQDSDSEFMLTKLSILEASGGL